MFIASGTSITAIPSTKKAKRWSYTLPAEAMKAIAPFGQPIIAHGMLHRRRQGRGGLLRRQGGSQGAAGGAHGGHN